MNLLVWIRLEYRAERRVFPTTALTSCPSTPPGGKPSERPVPSCKSPESTKRRSTSFSYGQGHASYHHARRLYPLTRAISFMCVTKDAKSPKSPLHTVPCYHPILPSPSPERRVAHSPVVRLRERRFLVPEQPAMAVGGVNDVHVAPDERPGRGRELGLRERAPLVFVRVTMFFAWARTGRERSKAEREQRRELHPSEPSTDESCASGVYRGETGRTGQRRQAWRRQRLSIISPLLPYATRGLTGWASGALHSVTVV